MTALDKCKAFLLDIAFPNRCPFCDEFIAWDGYVCDACIEKYASANGVICRKCGREECVCGDTLCYDMAFASFFYSEEPVREAIYRLKDIGEINIAEYTAADIEEYMKRENIPKPDIVVPVPMGRKKRRKRGYNQAELLARCIGKHLDIPVRSDILFKYDTKEEQHDFGAEERLKRVKSLFYTGKTDLSGKTVMLCDDIMTTGATVNECARLLKELGAESVCSAVCALTRLEKTSEEVA